MGVIVLQKNWNLQSGGLLSRTIGFASAGGFTCASERLGAYCLEANNLEPPISDLTTRSSVYAKSGAYCLGAYTSQATDFGSVIALNPFGRNIR